MGLLVQIGLLSIIDYLPRDGWWCAVQPKSNKSQGPGRLWGMVGFRISYKMPMRFERIKLSFAILGAGKCGVLLSEREAGARHC